MSKKRAAQKLEKDIDKRRLLKALPPASSPIPSPLRVIARAQTYRARPGELTLKKSDCTLDPKAKHDLVRFEDLIFYQPSSSPLKNPTKTQPDTEDENSNSEDDSYDKEVFEATSQSNADNYIPSTSWLEAEFSFDNHQDSRYKFVLEAWDSNEYNMCDEDFEEAEEDLVELDHEMEEFWMGEDFPEEEEESDIYSDMDLASD